MQKIIYSAFLLLTFVLYAEDNLLESYDNAQESYRNDENEEAIQRFNRFIESNPESDKADDSLWYLGRLYNRLGDIDQAKEYFEEVLSLEDSNRITEAFYDLSKILDDQQDYQRIIELFPLIYPMEEADSYTVKALPMVVNSYYKLVFNNRNSRAGSWAEEMLQQALTLVENYRDKEYANEIQEDLADLNAKILIRLSVVTASKEDYVSYLNKALEQLDKDLQRGFISNESADNYREKINESLAGAFSLDYQVETSGEYNGMTNEMGFQVDSKIKGTHELSNIQEFQWSLNYQYIPFSFKTFNFSDGKTGDQRYFEWSQEIKGDISYQHGSKYYFLQTFDLGVDLNIGEDPGSLNYGGDFSWDLDGRFYSLGTWSWDNSVSVSIYPDYTNAGRELNSFVISTAPEYTLYIMDNSQLSLGYALDYKYYLNAQFETPTGGIDSNNRFYLIHDLNLNFETTPIKPLTLGMDYQFRYHDSYHYNLTLFGYPSNQYVEDFFDYIRNEISIYTGLSLGNYDLDIQGTWSLRDFQNYPARDSTKTFIDQLRSDTAISVKIENSYELLDNPQFGKLSIFLNGMWEQEVSNHSYEVSYLTNYENYTLSLGLQWKD